MMKDSTPTMGPESTRVAITWAVAPNVRAPSAIVANVAGKATQASATYTAKQTAQSTYASSLSSQSGVNIDQESANLSALQNKYAAASQIITAINAMFSALMTAMSSG